MKLIFAFRLSWSYLTFSSSLWRMRKVDIRTPLDVETCQRKSLGIDCCVRGTWSLFYVIKLLCGEYILWSLLNRQEFWCFSLSASKGNPTHAQASILTLGPTHLWHALRPLHLYCAQLSAHFSISIHNVNRPANMGMIIVQLQLSGTVAAVESRFS